MSYKTLSVSDFVKFGYLQEINRRLLHPLGLDLQVKQVDGGLEFKDIVDCRDNENGISFKEGYLDVWKSEYIEFEYNKKVLNRLVNLGYSVQPINKD